MEEVVGYLATLRPNALRTKDPKGAGFRCTLPSSTVRIGKSSDSSLASGTGLSRSGTARFDAPLHVQSLVATTQILYISFLLLRVLQERGQVWSLTRDRAKIRRQTNNNYAISNKGDAL